MTTTKVSMTTDKPAPPPADYAEAIGNGLREKQASNNLWSQIRGLPKRARGWTGSALRTLHLDGVASSAGDGVSWLWARAQRGMRFVRRLGLFQIAGAIITVPALRESAVSVLAKAYRVVRKPFEWAHRGLSWLCRKSGFTWGEKMLAKGAERGEKIENWVADKVDQGMDWLESNDRHPVMRGLRGIFQFTILRRAITMIFPEAPSWMTSGLAAAVPVVGDRAMAEAVKSEDAAIEKAKEALSDKVGTKEMTVEAKPAAPRPRPTKANSNKPAASVTIKTLALTDSSLPADKATFEAVAEVNEMGVMRIRLGSQLLHVEELPETISIVGEHAGEGDQVLIPHPKLAEVERTVRQAQASPSGRPPTLPRAARRAAARGKAPAKQ